MRSDRDEQTHTHTHTHCIHTNLPTPYCIYVVHFTRLPFVTCLRSRLWQWQEACGSPAPQLGAVWDMHHLRDRFMKWRDVLYTSRVLSQPLVLIDRCKTIICSFPAFHCLYKGSHEENRSSQRSVCMVRSGEYILYITLRITTHINIEHYHTYVPVCCVDLTGLWSHGKEYMTKNGTCFSASCTK